jgi:oligosaccharyltransferase complex subunit alpha (ribophorin I)
VSTDIVLHKTFLDTVGRTTLVIKARNLVDDFRDRELVVSYDYSVVALLRKPFIVFTGMIAVFIGAWIIGGVKLQFSGKKA